LKEVKMPIPLLIPPQEDPHRSEKPSLHLVKSQAAWNSAALAPRAIAHVIDWMLVVGFSLYVSKLLSLVMVKMLMPEIQQSGKFAGKLFVDAMSYGESQIKFATILFFSLLYFVGFPLWRGKTVGLGLLGLKIEDQEGKTPSAKALGIRYIGCLLIYASAGALLFQWFRGADRPIVHDSLSNTRVVKH
jgi:hypothetical protein